MRPLFLFALIVCLIAGLGRHAYRQVFLDDWGLHVHLIEAPPNFTGVIVAVNGKQLNAGMQGPAFYLGVYLSPSSCQPWAIGIDTQTARPFLQRGFR